MRTQTRIDLEIASLADRQHGVLARSQLLALGISPDAIGRRVRAQRLRPLQRGVYAVGHRRLRREAFWLAAVLACGPGAVLSHVSAAALWGLRRSSASRIDVTVPSARERRRPGIRVHRHAALLGHEVTTYEGIPVTTPARTLLDLAATLPRRAVERALDEAEIMRLFDLAALLAAIRAHPRRPGTPLLTALLASRHAGRTPTRSELEERFLGLCDARRIPRPRVNARVAGMEVDFHWPDLRLVVEVDGYAYHHTRRAFERDRERDAALSAAGLRVQRFSHHQVTGRPDTVAAVLTALGASTGHPVR